MYNLNSFHRALLTVDYFWVDPGHTVPDRLCKISTQIFNHILPKIITINVIITKKASLPNIFPTIFILPIDTMIEGRYFFVEHCQQVDVVIEYKSLYLPDIRATVWVHYEVYNIFFILCYFIQV
jgi:hypothetical protein